MLPVALDSRLCLCLCLKIHWNCISGHYFLDLRILEDRVGNVDFILEVLGVSYSVEMSDHDSTAATYEVR